MRKEKVRLIDSIITSINERLENETWTMNEFEEGKVIEIKEQWAAVIKIVCEEYRRSGWSVSRHVQISSTSPGPFHYLKFLNPHYLAIPEEMRTTGVRTKRKKIII